MAARERWRVGLMGDAAEIARGMDDGRPRNKFTDVADMLAAAATAPPAPKRRLLARLLG